MHIIRNDKGFSLLGALIGMAIFVIGILAVIALQTQALLGTGRATIRSEATTWGQDEAERVNALPYDDPKLEPPYASANDPGADPLEPVGSFAGGLYHQEIQGPYTVTWVVFTDAQNGNNLNAYPNINNLPMFTGVTKTQAFQDIPVNSKLIYVHVAHPRENGQRFVFVKSNT